MAIFHIKVTNTENNEVLAELLGRQGDVGRHYTLAGPNAPSSLCSSQLTKHGTVVLPHPLCSPTLTPCEFYLLPQMKDQLVSSYLRDTEEVQVALKIALGELYIMAPRNILNRCMNAHRSVSLLKNQCFECNCA